MTEKGQRSVIFFRRRLRLAAARRRARARTHNLVACVVVVGVRARVLRCRAVRCRADDTTPEKRARAATTPRLRLHRSALFIYPIPIFSVPRSSHPSHPLCGARLGELPFSGFFCIWNFCWVVCVVLGRVEKATLFDNREITYVGRVTSLLENTKLELSVKKSHTHASVCSGVVERVVESSSVNIIHMGFRRSF